MKRSVSGPVYRSACEPFMEVAGWLATQDSGSLGLLPIWSETTFPSTLCV